MNTTSLQGTTYNHFQQTQVLGQSGLKILDGEDLSILFLIHSLWRQKKVATIAGQFLVQAADRVKTKKTR